MKKKNTLYVLSFRKSLLFFLLIGLINISFGFNNSTKTTVFTAKISNDNYPVRNKSISTNTTELHRFWLNLRKDTSLVGQTLIGYATGATQGVDNGIDALYFNDSPIALTSLINDNEYIIQGRSVPFLVSDIVRLGFKSDIAGNFTISLFNFDGLFLGNQAIFLKDNATGILHNLKLANYVFTSEIGVFNNRFEIHYKNDTTTYENGFWNYGVPNNEMNAIIATDFTTSTDLVVKSLTINSSAVFTVASGTKLTVVNEIENEGGVSNFIIENDAMIFQNSSEPNSVLATVKRNSHQLFQLDYALWSSPVSTQNLRSFSSQTYFNRFYSYNNSIGTNGAYQQEIFTTADMNNKLFASGKGYLIRMPNNWITYNSTNIPQNYNGIFKGLLNNGAISVPLSNVNARLNLVGNPYPSPISIQSLFDENPTIEKTIYFWRKVGSANPLNTSSGYATLNMLGIVFADTNVSTPTEIQTGQGFFVVANATNPGNLVFDNSMRSDGNPVFFKSPISTNHETNRYWLNVSNATGVVGQTLIAYASFATQGVDAGMDALYINDSSLALTSLIENNEYIIQGRSLPFSSSDVVPLGFKSNVSADFTISLANFDGLFTTNQEIFLHDKLTQLWTNLKVSAYTFATSEGVFNERFEIHYNNTLAINSKETLLNQIIIGIQNKEIIINAGFVTMDKIEIIDSMGRIIYSQKNVNDTKSIIKDIIKNDQMLIIKISTKEHGIINKKFVF